MEVGGQTTDVGGKTTDVGGKTSDIGGKTTDKDFMTSSDQEPLVFCQPCSIDGEHIEAAGYCQTCDEYLCGACYKYHRRQKISRHHVLQDKLTMPALKSTNQSLKPGLCTLPCPDHTGKVLEYFCPTHNISLCVVCSTTKHKSCDVEYIPDLKTAVNYKDSAEYKTIISRLQVLQTDSEKLIDDTKTAIEEIEDNVDAKIEEMEEFRDEIVERINHQVKKLRDQAIKEKEVHKSSQQNLAEELETLKDEVIQSEQKLIALVNESSNLFATSKMVLQEIRSFEKSLGKLVVNNQTPVFRFKKSEDLQRLVSSDGELGNFEVSYKPRVRSVDFTNVVVTRLPDLNMKLRGDRRHPSITGLAYLHPDTLFAVDCNNKKIKVVNIASHTIKSQLSFSGNPHDITLLPGNQEAAVTIPYENRIQVISTSGQLLSCLRSIPVAGPCWGICSTSSNIIVSFHSPSPKVQVMDIKGKVLTTFDTDVDGKQLFTNPYYISVAEEDRQEMILVSDYSTDTVTKLTMQGKVVSTYAYAWRGIYGIEAVGGKQVLVCNREGDTVDVVDEDKGTVVTLLDKKTHRIDYPRTLCYCPVQGKLLISLNEGPVWVFDIQEHK